MKTITKGVLFLISVTAFGVERVIPNYDLNQGLHFGPPPLKKLFETHLSMYPKSLPHQYINFMTNLDRMVDLQGHLRNQISRMPGFQKDISERGPMIDLTIAVTESFEMQVGRFDPFFLNLFSSDMTQIIKGRVESAAKGLLASIRKRFPDLEYRMDGSLADFETNRKFEKILISYVMGYGLTNGWKSLDALKGDIHLGEGHIDYLAEKEMWGKALDGLLEEEKDQEKLIKLATDIFRRWEVRLKGSQDERLRTITVPKGETFHVYEVHPDLAILRGFVGNDCATDVSFGFPYSPFERNYYVANKKHDFLGYIALSIAEIAGERVIFFHTIAGPGVDYLASDLIVRAFVSKAKLIVEKEW